MLDLGQVLVFLSLNPRSAEILHGPDYNPSRAQRNWVRTGLSMNTTSMLPVLFKMLISNWALEKRWFFLCKTSIFIGIKWQPYRVYSDQSAQMNWKSSIGLTLESIAQYYNWMPSKFLGLREENLAGPVSGLAMQDCEVSWAMLGRA